LLIMIHSYLYVLAHHDYIYYYYYVHTTIDGWGKQKIPIVCLSSIFFLHFFHISSIEYIDGPGII